MSALKESVRQKIAATVQPQYDFLQAIRAELPATALGLGAEVERDAEHERDEQREDAERCIRKGGDDHLAYLPIVTTADQEHVQQCQQERPYDQE